MMKTYFYVLSDVYHPSEFHNIKHNISNTKDVENFLGILFDIAFRDVMKNIIPIIIITSMETLQHSRIKNVLLSLK